MALNYDDYMKQGTAASDYIGGGNTTVNLNVEDELKEAREKSEKYRADQPKGFAIPERFEGKSAEDVAKSYVELEKLNSRQAQDLGEQRKLTDSLIQMVQPPSVSSGDSYGPTNEQTANVTVDELYEKPQETIEKVASSIADTRVKELEERLSRYEGNANLEVLEKKHPRWQETVDTPEFKNFVTDKQYRQRLAVAASQNDLQAADELLEMYEDVTGVSDRRDADQRRAVDLQNATLETGAAPLRSGTSDQMFSRSDLLEMRIRAQQGDDKAERKLNSLKPDIMKAYEEGRVTD